MPEIPDRLIPVLKERMQKVKLNPDPDPVRKERALMEIAGSVMEHTVRGGFERHAVALKNCEALLLVPKKVHCRGSILYLHGGGYCTGDLEYAAWFGKIIAAKAGARTLCPAYRLAPEHPFPAALNDALDAYRFLLADRPDAPVCLIGESAGGGLILSLCVKLKELGFPLPAGLVMISPWTDLTLSGGSYVYNREADPSMTREKLKIFAESYTADPKDPLCSPLFADLFGLPESLLFAGGSEIMLDDTLRLYEALRAAGCESSLTVAEGLWHAYIFYGLKSRREDVRRIVDFMRGKLS